MKKHRLVSIGLAAILAVSAFAVPVTAATGEIEYQQITVPEIPKVQKHKFNAKSNLANNYKSVTSKKVNFYYETSTDVREDTVYFFNGNTSVPYMELSNLFTILKDVYNNNVDDVNYDIDCGYSKDKFTVYRENGASMTFDLKKNEIVFDDYDLFTACSVSLNGGDICAINRWFYNEDGSVQTDKEGNPLVNLLYTSSDGVGNFQRSGYTKYVTLGDYKIKTYIKSGKAYIPVATFSDIFLQLGYYGMVYNGSSMFVMPLGELDTETKDKNGKTIGDLFKDVGGAKRSKQLAEFNYYELCLLLDLNYGLAPEHGIYIFDYYFESVGLKERLLSTEEGVYTKAMIELTSGYLGDLHSNFNRTSPYEPEMDYLEIYEAGSDNASKSQGDFLINYFMYSAYREKKGNNVLDKKGNVIPYKEVGNTAYLTFDSFSMRDDTEYYYSDEFKKDYKKLIDSDTIALVYYANKQITRKNSPIENVVIDLSVNSGGAVDAGVFLVSWLIGSCNLNTMNAQSLAQYGASYRADINLDGHIGSDDTLSQGINSKVKVYCLTSPVSFSCGNLVPAILKDSGRATILGRTSGGGACAVQPAYTADGTFFQYSGKFKLCTSKNGIFYSVDEGVDPDYTITDIAHFYDRKWLTNYINKLP